MSAAATTAAAKERAKAVEGSAEDAHGKSAVVGGALFSTSFIAGDNLLTHIFVSGFDLSEVEFVLPELSELAPAGHIIILIISLANVRGLIGNLGGSIGTKLLLRSLMDALTAETVTIKLGISLVRKRIKLIVGNRRVASDSAFGVPRTERCFTSHEVVVTVISGGSKKLIGILFAGKSLRAAGKGVARRNAARIR